MTTKKRTPRKTTAAPKEVYAASPEHIPTIIDQHTDRLIDDAVEDATRHYAEGRPGRGEFILARLGEKLTRLERTAKDLQDALS